MTDTAVRRRKPRSRLLLPALAPAILAAALQSCIFGSSDPPADTVSPERSQLIAAAGGFICLYRAGANPADLLYVQSAAGDAGLQVVFKIAESSVIPEAIRKGWGDVAVGFTEAEVKNLGLRVVSVPRSTGEFSEDAGTGVYLLRSGDTLLDAVLDPAKKLPSDVPLPGFSTPETASPGIITFPDDDDDSKFFVSTDPTDLLP